jgi:hypothetical protein
VNPVPASIETLGDEEYVLPSVDALMAGTLALMTGYAQAAETCAHRPLMAKKLVSNLFFLANHPHVSPTMRCMLGNLRTRWQLTLEASVAPVPTPAATWMPAHDTLQ